MNAPVIDVAVRAGHRSRSPIQALAEIHGACKSLGELSKRGIGAEQLPRIEQTVEGLRRVLIDLRAGGVDHAA